MAAEVTLEEVLALAAETQYDWDERIAELRASGVPVMVDDSDADEDDRDDVDDGDDRDDDDDSRDDSRDDDDDDDDRDDVDDDDEDSRRPVDWKKHSRRHERNEKRLRRENDELKSAAAKAAKKGQTEQQRAIDDARRKGEEEAGRRFSAQLRETRLENSVSQLATRGVEIEISDKDGKKSKEKVSFVDPDDAMLQLQRMVAKGDLDEDDLFDKDGKVVKSAVQEALAEILEEKKHLRAGSDKDDGDTSRKKKRGESDAGKGRGGAKPLEEMSPDEHFKAIKKH